jgi:hypothetical protein
VPFKHKKRLSEADVGILASLNSTVLPPSRSIMNPCAERACRVSLHRNYSELNPAGLSCVECICIGDNFLPERSRYAVEQRPTMVGPRTRLAEHMRTENAYSRSSKGLK